MYANPVPSVSLTPADVERVLAVMGIVTITNADELTGDDILAVHRALHDDARERGVSLFYGSGDSLHDKLSDVVFERV
jgi:hypothetical protein